MAFAIASNVITNESLVDIRDVKVDKTLPKNERIDHYDTWLNVRFKQNSIYIERLRSNDTWHKSYERTQVFKTTCLYVVVLLMFGNAGLN